MVFSIDFRMVVGLIVYGVDLLLGLNFLVMMWKKKRLRGFGFCLQSETQNKIPGTILIETL